MYKKKVLTTIYLDKRRSKIDKSYPVKLRVTFQRYRKYYSLGDSSLTIDEFNKVMGDNPKGKYRKLRNTFEEFKHEADEVIKNINSFAFEKFEMEFFKKSSSSDDVFSFYDQYIEQLRMEGRINTADSYAYSKKSIQEYTKSTRLSFSRITKEFLENYEADMLKNGKSITTIGIYLRSLRTIVNMGIRSGLADHYPFGKGNQEFMIKNPPARKMALTTSELKSMFEYKAFETRAEHYFFDLWKFSYLCGGMNVKDISHLKYNNIIRDRIFYKREKTKRSNYNGKEIVIPISEKIEEIIDKWGQKSKESSTFVFPILMKHFTPEQTQATIKQATKQIIKYVRRVSKRLEIEIPVSTYTARHSFATQLMRHGAPTEFISKQLGHSDVKTTASYLENFEERQLKEWQGKVTDFDL